MYALYMPTFIVKIKKKYYGILKSMSKRGEMSGQTFLAAVDGRGSEIFKFCYRV